MTYGKGGLVRELTSYFREKYKRDEERNIKEMKSLKH